MSLATCNMGHLTNWIVNGMAAVAAAFLSEQGRRNLLGETARKVFNL